MASFVASVPVTLVNCEPLTAGKPTASNNTTLPFDVPVLFVAAVPSPKFVRAVPALFRSLKFDAIESLLVSVLVTLVSCEPSTAGSRDDPSS